MEYEQFSFLRPLQNIAQQRTKERTHLDIYLLGLFRQNVNDDVQLHDLVAWVLPSKFPPQCLVLLCLLSILLRAVVQSWTAHFHSHHTHLLVVYKW